MFYMKLLQSPVVFMRGKIVGLNYESHHMHNSGEGTLNLMLLDNGNGWWGFHLE